ncbi:MAG: DsrE family protein [Chloroflexi bacterium]|nr:DsrE family protein [Chloroflexota bacterium]
MSKPFLIVLRHAPYGRLDGAEVVRHLNGAVASGLDAAALLLGDGVYLAKAGQVAAPGWTELAAALAHALRAAGADGGPPVAVYVHAPALQTRGLTEADLVPGCRIAQDTAAADLIAAAVATLVY